MIADVSFLLIEETGYAEILPKSRVACFSNPIMGH